MPDMHALLGARAYTCWLALAIRCPGRFIRHFSLDLGLIHDEQAQTGWRQAQQLAHRIVDCDTTFDLDRSSHRAGLVKLWHCCYPHHLPPIPPIRDWEHPTHGGGAGAGNDADDGADAGVGEGAVDSSGSGGIRSGEAGPGVGAGRRGAKPAEPVTPGKSMSTSLSTDAPPLTGVIEITAEHGQPPLPLPLPLPEWDLAWVYLGFLGKPEPSFHGTGLLGTPPPSLYLSLSLPAAGCSPRNRAQQPHAPPMTTLPPLLSARLSPASNRLPLRRPAALDSPLIVLVWTASTSPPRHLGCLAVITDVIETASPHRTHPLHTP